LNEIFNLKSKFLKIKLNDLTNKIVKNVKKNEAERDL
jgi:hypothetical protein